MFITIYKKTRNNELFLIRFELINNKYRKWHGKENRVLKAFQWKEFTTFQNQTGKARAAYAMFQEINKLVGKGYAIYKKKSKKIKTIKPIIKVKKFSMAAIKKLHDEGHTLYYNACYGKLAVRKTNGCLYDNFTHKRIGYIKYLATIKQELGDFYENIEDFKPFHWDYSCTPKELEIWTVFNRSKNIKTIVKINNTYYV